VTTRLEIVGGVVDSSIFAALERLGERPELAFMVHGLFPDLVDHASPRDEFRLIVEKRVVGDEVVDYGRLLAAEYKSAKRHTSERAFYFDLGGDAPGGAYYTEDGAPVRPRGFTPPAQEAMRTSGFGSRDHPVYGHVSAHLGVDFAAPIGTPVRAARGGVVQSARRDGDFGNMVTIVHGRGLVTRYAHLDGFAEGITEGARVQRGDCIGSIGLTGLSTGPHVHFETIVAGRHVDPEKIMFRRGPLLSTEQFAAFKQAIGALAAALSASPDRETALAL
jgi:murein DD-endopeptidase MepM/ murein hydrolase activator NlpD